MKRASKFVAILLSVSILTPTMGSATPLSSFKAYRPMSRHGNIVSSFTPNGAAPRVILIQDLHANASVQFHISAIVKRLSEKNLLGPWIGLEGASGVIDRDAMIQDPVAERRHEVSNYLVRNAEMTGAEHAVVVNTLPQRLFGIEDKPFYDAHVSVFRKSYSLSNQAVASVERLDQALALLNKEALSADQKTIVARLIKDVASIKNLLQHQMLPEEVSQVLRDAEKALQDLPVLREAMANNDKSLAALERVTSAAVNYYTLAFMRDEAMATNALALLDKQGNQPGVLALVVGGFHTPGISKILELKNIPYLVIMPEIDRHSPDDDALYHQRLMGHHLTPQEVVAGIDQTVQAKANGLGYITETLPALYQARAGMAKTAALSGLGRIGSWIMTPIRMVLGNESGHIALGRSNPSPENIKKRVLKALGVSNLPEGSVILWPVKNFMGINKKGMNAVADIKAMITPTRSYEEARAMLKQAAGKNPLVFFAHLRGLDGAGSSLDLPEFQKKLTQLKKNRQGLKDLPSTPTVASEFGVKVRFEYLADPDVIEYVAADYGIQASNPMRYVNGVRQGRKQNSPLGQLDAPGLIFAELFGIKGGVRIVLESIDPMARAGGMESSNVFNVALIAAASSMSGADLSQAEIFNLAVKLENDVLGGLTGGQGHLSALLGGAFRNIWLSGARDSEGTLPYGAVSIPLLPAAELEGLENHLMLVQAGKEYEDGNAVEFRTASMINKAWTDLLRDNDEVGLPLHQEKLGLTDRYAQALRQGDYEAAAAILHRYVEIRDTLFRRWITLVLDARAGKEVPAYAHGYVEKIFNPSHPDYNDPDWVELRDLTGKVKEDVLKNTSLYTQEPIAALVAKAWQEGIAIMPLGAGGPGANLAALDPKGMDHLREFMVGNGLKEIDEEKARTIMGGTGVLQGFIPFKVGREAMEMEGFTEAGFNLPEGPIQIAEPALSSETGATRSDLLVYLGGIFGGSAIGTAVAAIAGIALAPATIVGAAVGAALAFLGMHFLPRLFTRQPTQSGVRAMVSRLQAALRNQTFTARLTSSLSMPSFGSLFSSADDMITDPNVAGQVKTNRQKMLERLRTAA